MKGRRVLLWAMAGLLFSLVALASGAVAAEEPELKKTSAGLERGEQESQKTVEMAEKERDAERKGWRTHWEIDQIAPTLDELASHGYRLSDELRRGLLVLAHEA